MLFQCFHYHIPQDIQMLASVAAQLDLLLGCPLCFPSDVGDRCACFVGSVVPFQPVPLPHTFLHLP